MIRLESVKNKSSSNEIRWRTQSKRSVRDVKLGLFRDSINPILWAKYTNGGCDYECQLCRRVIKRWFSILVRLINTFIGVQIQNWNNWMVKDYSRLDYMSHGQLFGHGLQGPHCGVWNKNSHIVDLKKILSFTTYRRAWSANARAIIEGQNRPGSVNDFVFMELQLKLQNLTL